MSNDIQIEIDIKDIEKKLKKLSNIKNGANKAISASFNKTVTGMRTDAKNEAAARYTIKKKSDIAEKIELNKASSGNLSATMYSKGRPIRSIKFAHKANKKPGKIGAPGAKLSAKKGGSLTELTGDAAHSKAFVATMKNGAQGIFQRTSKKGNSSKTKTKGINRGSFRRSSPATDREGIEQVHAPGVAQMLSNKEVSTVIQEKASKRFEKEFDRAINMVLAKEKG